MFIIRLFNIFLVARLDDGFALALGNHKHRRVLSFVKVLDDDVVGCAEFDVHSSDDDVDEFFLEILVFECGWQRQIFVLFLFGLDPPHYEISQLIVFHELLFKDTNGNFLNKRWAQHFDKRLELFLFILSALSRHEVISNAVLVVVVQV